MNKTWNAARLLVVVGLTAVVSACGKNEEKQRQAAVDSMAEARARGETDLNNPEMGAKVLITLLRDSMDQSHSTVSPGQVTFAVQNHDSSSHVFQLTGATGNWRTIKIEPGGTVLMSMILPGGDYEMFCPDTASARDGCGAVRTMTAR